MSITEQDAALCDRNADSCRDSQYPEERQYEAVWRERANQIRTALQEEVYFSPSEIKAMRSNPWVLRALADQHDCWETEADAIGEPFAGAPNAARAAALRAEAVKIEATY